MNLDDRINQAMDDAREVWRDDAPHLAAKAQNSQRVAALGVLMAMVVAIVGIIWSTNQPEPPVVDTFPPATVIDSIPPPTTSTSIPPTSTVPGDEPITIIHGALLDGTTYTIHGEDLEDDEPRAVDGVVVYDDGGQVPVLGITEWHRSSKSRGTTYSDGELVVDTGGWQMIVELYDEVLATLGNDAGDILERSITGDQIDKHPVLRFSGPFRLAADHEVPRNVEVKYGDFAVRRGCSGASGSECNLHRSVELIDARIEAGQPPPVDETTAFLSNTGIESTAPRPTSDPFYFNPGPLGPRIGHDLFWRDGQLIVWGGVWGEAISYWTDYKEFDGAVLDWDTRAWSMIPPPPFELPKERVRDAQDRDASPAPSVLEVDRLVVAFGTEVAAWDLSASGGWETWEDAPFPVRDLTLSPDDHVVAIGYDSQMALRQEDGAWVELPIADEGGPGDAIFVEEGQFYRVLQGHSASCLGEGVPVLRLDEDTWETVGIIDISTAEYAACHIPAETMMAHHGILYAWQDEEMHTVAIDLSDGSVRDIDRIPIAGCDFAFPPISAGNRIVAGNGCNETLAVLDTTTETWRQHQLVGPMTNVVWTGEELVGWSVPWESETPDAWHLPLDNP